MTGTECPGGNSGGKDVNTWFWRIVNFAWLCGYPAGDEKKLVIQWGTVTVPTAGAASATYPLALDLGLTQFCTPIDVSSINNYRVGVATSTKASITLASTNTQSVTGVMWLSIGTIN